MKRLYARTLPLLLLVVASLLMACNSMPVKDQAAAEPVSNPAAEANREMAAGDAAFKDANFEKALFHYVVASRLDQESSSALVRMGLVHETQGNIDKAAIAYRAALQRNADSVAANEGMGVVLLRQGEAEQASVFLQVSHAADGNRWRTLNALAVIEDLKQNYAAAHPLYEQALAQRPEHVRLLNNAGFSRYLAQDNAGARAYFQRALAVAPRYRAAWFNLALLEVREGRYDQALSMLEQFQSRSEALNTIGYLAMLDGENELAERYLRAAIRSSGSFHASAHSNLELLRKRNGSQ